MDFRAILNSSKTYIVALRWGRLGGRGAERENKKGLKKKVSKIGHEIKKGVPFFGTPHMKQKIL